MRKLRKGFPNSARSLNYVSGSGEIYTTISLTPYIMKRTGKFVSPVFLARRGAWQRAHPWSYKYPRWLQYE